jgi:hypothetical protein
MRIGERGGGGEEEKERSSVNSKEHSYGHGPIWLQYIDVGKRRRK